MIRTIAVGFDGSPDAERALGWAADLARQVDGELVVVHAVGLLEHVGSPPSASEYEATVRAVASRHDVDPARVRWHPVDGDPCSALLRAASPPVSAELVVVGSRGQGAHSGLLLGSTSHELAEHSAIPVVIVPSGGLTGDAA